MIPFIGSSHPLPLDRVDLQRSINLYEVSAEDDGEKSEKHLAPAPGLTLFSVGAAPGSIGFGDPISSSAGAIAHANTGSRNFGIAISDLYGGVVAYTAGTVVWSHVWAPTGSPSTPEPSFSIFGTNNEHFHVTVNATMGDPWAAPGGLYTITATIAGVPTDSVQIAIGAGTYGAVAWGPVP